ncbi:MAG: hypothetical protein CVU65_17955 [Deltaproteobacteria bacterium HGW-Deltaproteobacteria-22]|nr:MAG: hypothetical protein CVU65_17955 [Deltaproteobacteria bacterium HGW-Deltaproteobacteria-22]
MKIELLFSTDDPNAESTWSLLQEVGRNLVPEALLERREIRTFKKAAEAGLRGSPTILVDGRDLEGPGKPSDGPGHDPLFAVRQYRDVAGVPPRWLIEAAILRQLKPEGVLFLCVANSARSQLAEGIARSIAPASVRILSAGSSPAPIRPETTRVLAAMAIDAGAQSPKSVDTIDPAQVDTVITLCDEEVCPVFLGKARRLHWGLTDPAGTEGSPAEKLNAFFRTANEIKSRLEVIWKPDPDAVRRQVSEFYAEAVSLGATGDCGAGDCGTASSCCGTSTGCCSGGSTAGLAGYDEAAFSMLPAGLRNTTFGCGDPVSVAEIQPGQTVLDLGCGAGLDLLLAAGKTGPTGRVIGVDMTQRMLDQARANVNAAGHSNVELRLGTIEDLPVEDASVDWVISNCVINLSPEKNRVWSELFRVLRPGGQIRVSDITAEDMPAWARRSMHMYASCIAGAVPVQDYLDGLTRAGLTGARALSMHVYSTVQLQALVGTPKDADECESGCCDCSPSISSTYTQRLLSSLQGKIATVLFTAKRPI